MIEDIIAQTVRLALAGGVPLWVVLVLIVAVAVLMVLARNLPPTKPELPQPPAEWNQDPANGAVVVPGPPGGSEEQDQGG